MARRHAVEAAIERLRELGDESWTRDDTVERMTGVYEFRRRRIVQRIEARETPLSDGDEDLEQRSVTYQRTQREVLEAQRVAVIRLRNDGTISDEVMHLIERELDLEDERLEI